MDSTLDDLYSDRFLFSFVIKNVKLISNSPLQTHTHGLEQKYIIFTIQLRSTERAYSLNFSLLTDQYSPASWFSKKEWFPCEGQLIY